MKILSLANNICLKQARGKPVSKCNFQPNHSQQPVNNFICRIAR